MMECIMSCIYSTVNRIVSISWTNEFNVWIQLEVRLNAL